MLQKKKINQNLKGKHLRQNLFLIKLWAECLFFIKETLSRGSSCEFYLIFKSNCGWLLLAQENTCAGALF